MPRENIWKMARYAFIIAFALLVFNLFAGAAAAQSACGSTPGLEIELPGGSYAGSCGTLTLSVGAQGSTVWLTAYGPNGDTGYVCSYAQASQPSSSQILSSCPLTGQPTVSLTSAGDIISWNLGQSAQIEWFCVIDTSTSPISVGNCVDAVINGGGAGGGTTLNGIIGTVCGIYYAVSTTIFILGLMLMILGGAVYAGSHLLPGQSRGPLQGYGMGMVMGGLIGVVIAVLAPFILSVITGNAALTSVCV